jgi:hypothetical protein
MSFLGIINGLGYRVREFVAPRYRPEKHYMRGFGPACAARQAARR